MVTAKVKIKNVMGLHLRPAALLCKEAYNYKSTVTIKVRNVTVDGKSILGVLGAGVKCGEEVELICEGLDEEEALASLYQLIESGLGEME